MLIPRGHEHAAFSASRLFAAVYPEATSIAVLLASPTWRLLAAGAGGELRTFTAEIGRRLGHPGYHPRNHGDAIGHWIAEDCWRPPSPPPATFPAAPGHRRPSQLSTQNKLSSTRHQTATLRFTIHRRPGNVILHHGTLRPVIIREWSPAMDRYTGAIWQAQRTETRKPGQANRTAPPPPALPDSGGRPESSQRSQPPLQADPPGN